MGFFWPFMNIKLKSGNVGKITHDSHGPLSMLPHSSIFNYFKDRFANIFIPSFYGVSGENESLLIVSFFFFFFPLHRRWGSAAERWQSSGVAGP